FSAAAVIMSCAPLAAFNAAAASVLVDEDFSDGVTGWSTYVDESASASLSAASGKAVMNVVSEGDLSYSVQLYYPGLSLYEGCEYRLTYEISSTINRYVEAMIQKSSGDYHGVSWRNVNASSTPQTYTDTFTMTESLINDAQITFTCGDQGTDLAEHNVYIDNVKLELVSGNPPAEGTDNNILYPDKEGAVYINEVCVQNKNCLFDSYGTASDWIEIYNPCGTAVNLSGCGLSDDAANPYKWTFPEGYILEAGEYDIIYASKQASTDSEYHTGFGLSKSGETITITDPEGTQLQTVTTPALAEDVTYGRSPDSSETWSSMTPTPGAENIVSVPAPVFSAGSGFYDTEFELSLEAASGNKIYYTLDGSDPTTSDSAILYNGAVKMYDRTVEENVYSQYQHDDTAQSITLKMAYNAPDFNVDKVTVVRAAVKNADGDFSETVTNTYMIADSEKLEYYKDISVVSLVTDPDNLFDSDTGIYVAGNQYVNWKNSSSYDANKSEWDTDNIANFFSKGRTWERPVTVELFENGEAVHKQDMGIRIKGSSTRNSTQKSFNLYARSDYGDSKLDYKLFEDNISKLGKKIKKYDSISLRAVTNDIMARVRDYIAQDMLEDRESVVNAESKPCAVFLDGEYWGMYMLYEKLSNDYIESHYDIPEDQVALMKNGELEEGTSDDSDEWWYLGEYVKYNDPANESAYSYLESKIDMQSLIEHYCTGLYLATIDWPGYNIAAWKNNGAAIADNPYSDGRWRFIVYDLDYTMGLSYELINGEYYGGVEGYQYDTFTRIDSKGDYTPVITFRELLNNAEFRKQFALTYQDYANYVFAPETAEPYLEKYSTDTYSENVAQSLDRWNLMGIDHTGDMHLETIDSIRTFLENRAAYTLPHMKSYLGMTGTLETVTLKRNGSGQIKINTITPDLTSGSWSGQYYTDFPVTLTAVPAEGQTFTGWSGYSDSTEETITVSFSDAVTIQANFSDADVIDGDVNLDQNVNSADAVALQSYLLRKLEHTAEQYAPADINNDGSVDIFDMVEMRKLLIGVIYENNMLPDVSAWTYHSSSGVGTFSADSSADAFYANVTQAGEKPHKIQSQARNLTLEDGKTYVLSFEASCTEDTVFYFGLCRAAEDGTYPTCWVGEAPLTSDLKRYSFMFTVDYDTYNDWFLYFSYGGAVGNYTVKNAVLTELK
ncbi:MAG: CotH kinase family protein, partial [Ruminococcus sp.]|nr:CotH kinase family protein [Ruminococcus sp.]